MDAPAFVYTTYPSLVEAEKAGQSLVEAGLAACVNILPEMVSIFRWKGQIERGGEVVMIIKTREVIAKPCCKHGARHASIRDAGDCVPAHRGRGQGLCRLDSGRDGRSEVIRPPSST